MTHKCAAEGCTKEISLAYLMCRKHWWLVPAAIRRRILNTLADRDRTRYYRHVKAAVLEVAKAEGRQLELPVAG